MTFEPHGLHWHCHWRRRPWRLALPRGGAHASAARSGAARRRAGAAGAGAGGRPAHGGLLLAGHDAHVPV
eukprot:5791006-Prymnesium_polylepis.1